jgi:hypothetical protein
MSVMELHNRESLSFLAMPFCRFLGVNEAGAESPDLEPIKGKVPIIEHVEALRKTPSFVPDVLGYTHIKYLFGLQEEYCVFSELYDQLHPDDYESWHSAFGFYRSEQGEDREYELRRVYVSRVPDVEAVEDLTDVTGVIQVKFERFPNVKIRVSSDRSQLPPNALKLSLVVNGREWLTYPSVALVAPDATAVASGELWLLDVLTTAKAAMLAAPQDRGKIKTDVLTKIEAEFDGRKRPVHHQPIAAAVGHLFDFEAEHAAQEIDKFLARLWDAPVIVDVFRPALERSWQQAVEAKPAAAAGPLLDQLVRQLRKPGGEAAPTGLRTRRQQKTPSVVSWPRTRGGDTTPYSNEPTNWAQVTTALKAVAHSTDTMQGALSALDTKVDELRSKVDAITQRNDAMEKLDKRTDSYRTEIAQADAGNRISAVQLRRYDPARFQVAWFPGEAFDKVLQYLRNEHHPYLRIGEDDRVLLSRTLLKTLEGKFRTRTANIEDLFGGDIRYNHEVTARDDKAFLTLHRALEAYGPVRVSRRGEHYRFLLDERQYQHLKQNNVSGNWTYDSD